MTAVKVWNGSAWANSSTSEKVWNGSAWVPLAPAGGSTETLAWPFAPSSTDLNDGAGSYYGMGAQFYLSAGVTKNCVGINWRVPDHAPLPGSPSISHYAQLWRNSDNALLAEKAITPTPGGSQDFLFDSPVALSDGLTEEYVAGVYTFSYVFRSPSPGSGWDVQSPSGHVHHQATRLVVTSAKPTTLATWNPTNAWFYVAPIVEV